MSPAAPSMESVSQTAFLLNHNFSPARSLSLYHLSVWKVTNNNNNNTGLQQHWYMENDKIETKLSYIRNSKCIEKEIPTMKAYFGERIGPIQLSRADCQSRDTN